MSEISGHRWATNILEPDQLLVPQRWEYLATDTNLTLMGGHEARQESLIEVRLLRRGGRIWNIEPPPPSSPPKIGKEGGASYTVPYTWNPKGRYVHHAKCTICLKWGRRRWCEVAPIHAAHKVSRKRCKNKSPLYFCERIWSGEGLDPHACLVSTPGRLWIDPCAPLFPHPPTLYLIF